MRRFKVKSYIDPVPYCSRYVFRSMFLYPFTLLYYYALACDNRIVGTAATCFWCHCFVISYVNMTYCWIMMVLIVLVVVVSISICL
jgi:hypothetical protein